MEQYYSSSGATTSSSSHRGGASRELQGPRPAPLRVHGDSHKIRKPPPPQVREPVIIYAVSPKVVHADPAEFMSVVQRLTGGGGARRTHTHTHTAASSSSVVPAAPHHMPFFGVGHHAPSSSAPIMTMLPPPLAPHFPFQLQEEQAAAGGAHEMTTSPAARLAAIEQASSGLRLPPFPSVLSPAGPLPPIQPTFFSPPAGAGLGINLFGELISPAAAFLGAATSGSISTAAGAIGQNQQGVSPLPSAGAYDYWGDLFNNNQQHQHHHQ